MKDLAYIFRALADETRLKILVLVLQHGELCVCDFVQVLGITQSKASRHLRYLTHAGLLEDRRDGVWSYYRLSESLDEDRRLILEATERTISKWHKSELDRQLKVWQDRKCCTPLPAESSRVEIET